MEIGLTKSFCLWCRFKRGNSADFCLRLFSTNYITNLEELLRPFIATHLLNELWKVASSSFSSLKWKLPEKALLVWKMLSLFQPTFLVGSGIEVSGADSTRNVELEYDSKRHEVWKLPDKRTSKCFVFATCLNFKGIVFTSRCCYVKSNCFSLIFHRLSNFLQILWNFLNKKSTQVVSFPLKL